MSIRQWSPIKTELFESMSNPDVKTNQSRVWISIVTAVAVALASWLLIGRCPEMMSGIEALQRTWFWAGQACANQFGDGAGVFPLFGSCWLVAIQTTLNFGVLSPSTRRATKLISMTALAILFFILYMLIFVL
jgi:hypothetical protein